MRSGTLNQPGAALRIRVAANRNQTNTGAFLPRERFIRGRVFATMRVRADNPSTPEERQRDAAMAWREYLDEPAIIAERTLRLGAARLAKEEAIKTPEQEMAINKPVVTTLVRVR